MGVSPILGVFHILKMNSVMMFCFDNYKDTDLIKLIKKIGCYY